MTSSIGIDVGGTKLLGVVIDDTGNVLFEEREPTPRGKFALIESIAGLAWRLSEKSPEDDSSRTLGLGIPGQMDKNGHLNHAPNLPGVEDINFAHELEPQIGEKFLYADNDANCAAWGERTFGAGLARGNVIMVTLGTGIGGGIICDGKLLRGFHGFAAEPGHMVVDPNGPVCPCGQRGCWERFGSGSGLAHLGREEAIANRDSRMVQLAGGDPEAVKGENIVAAAKEGDDVALSVIDRYAQWVALGLSNLANLFDPELFVIGGGVIEAGDVVLAPIRTAYKAIPFHAPTEIFGAQLGEQAGAIGAADLARVMSKA